MTAVDRDIALAPMPKHSSPLDLGDLLIRVGKALKADGFRAEQMVALLAAQGWGTGTLGDGGARATDDTSSTERAGTADGGALDRWRGADRRYHALLAELEPTCQRFEGLHLDVLAHASDRDEVPAGTGECAACGRFCRPTKTRPGHRLKSNLCPACYGSWRDAGQPYPRTDWIRLRRARLTDDQGVVHPEDDSQLDLSTEVAP